MRDMERLQHELHAKLPAFQRKVERAIAIIEDVHEQTQETFYLAFSGGVDSTVLLDMLLRQERVDYILYGDDGFDYPETLEFIEQAKWRYHLDLRCIRCMQPWRDWCVEMSRPDLCNDPEALQAWGNPHNWHDTWDSLKDARNHGHGGVFLGLLASESRTRTYVLKGGSRPLYQVKSEGDMWHCSPLASWTKQDVWAYIVSRNVSYNPVYDKIAELGVSLERRRVAPLTCFRAMQYGSHQALKIGWTELYNKLCITFPRVREYT